MILLVGGTGTLGRLVQDRLMSQGRQVRVLTRAVTGARVDGGADVVVGDLRDGTVLARAVAGCSAVVSAAHGFLGGRGAGPEAVDDRGNLDLVRAATDAGVEQLVLLSVLGAAADHPMSLHRAKHAAEQHLRGTELTWTVLRPAAYTETWAGVVGAKLATGGPALVLGRGTNPINFVSAADVAVLVDRALSDTALRHQAIDVPGPEDHTMLELARLLGADTFRHVPRAALRLMSAATGRVSPAMARRAHAALVMDTEDMTADPSAVQRRFPDVVWHRVADTVRAAGPVPG